MVTTLFGCTGNKASDLATDFDRFQSILEAEEKYRIDMTKEILFFETVDSDEAISSEERTTVIEVDLLEKWIHLSSENEDIYQVKNGLVIHQYNDGDIVKQSVTMNPGFKSIQYFLGDLRFEMDYVYLTEVDQVKVSSGVGYQAEAKLADLSETELAAFEMILGEPIFDDDLSRISLTYEYRFDSDYTTMDFDITSNKIKFLEDDSAFQIKIHAKVSLPEELLPFFSDTMDLYYQGGSRTEDPLFLLDSEAESKVYLSRAVYLHYQVYLEPGQYILNTSPELSSNNAPRLLDFNMHEIPLEGSYNIETAGYFYLIIVSGNPTTNYFTLSFQKINSIDGE